MLLLLVLIIGVMFAGILSTKSEECPTPLINSNKVTRCVRYGSTCYNFLGELPRSNWTAAQDACERIGSHLPIFHTKLDYERFNELRQKWHLNGQVLPIGLKFDDINFEKESIDGWKWIDGSPLEYSSWGPYDPDPHHKTLYAYDIGLWFDAKVSTKYVNIPICQRKCNVLSAACVTPGCIQAAEHIIEALDDSVDPCQDFYSYACGGWMQRHPIPQDKSSYLTYTAVREKVSSQIADLLQDRNVSSGVPRPIAMAKQYYSACVDSNRLNLDRSKPLFGELKALNLGPMLFPNWSCGHIDLTSIFAQLYLFSSPTPYFSLSIEPDIKNVSRKLLHFREWGTLLGRRTERYYLDEKYSHIIDALKRKMTSTFEAIAEDNSVALNDINGYVDKLIAFDKEIAKILIPESQRGDQSVQYNKRQLKDLQKIIPFIDWKTFFNICLPSDVHLAEDTDIIINDMKHFLKLAELMQNTDCSVKSTYLTWNLVDAYVNTGALGDTYDDIHQEFMQIYKGRPSKPNPSSTCFTNLMYYGFGPAVGAMYVKQYFDVTARAQAMDMVQRIRGAFTEMVKGLDWMDEETKQYTYEKAEAMKALIGFPHISIDDYLLEQYYQRLQFQNNATYFEMMKSYWSFNVIESFRSLLKPVDRSEWTMSPATVNAYYSGKMNHLALTAAVLQPPFYNSNYPKAVNYGAIGSFAGHEITHGFDTKGRQYNKVGNLINWWNSETTALFSEKAQCFIDQYANIEVEDTDGLKINGQYTLTENIADSGGLKESYLAYQNYMNSAQTPEAALPGLEHLNANQIFFISYAQLHCGNYRPEALVNLVLTNIHSPPKYRVNVPLGNMKEFSQDFQCQLGTPMNPVKKCSVW